MSEWNRPTDLIKVDFVAGCQTLHRPSGEQGVVAREAGKGMKLMKFNVGVLFH